LRRGAAHTDRVGAVRLRKGAFTGATARKHGHIEHADRGTLFLDEIGDMPIDLQGLLLRFLQEGEILPVGVRQPIKVDVRVVAATNVRLREAIAAGKLREDLYYRLNVLTIHLPPRASAMAISRF
jgi:two-component system response regulator HydG